MPDIWNLWAEWSRPSAGLPTLQWSILLGLAAMAGYAVQRYSGLPKILGYSLVGTLAGWAGFSGAAWPLQGTALFLLELGVAMVLFEAGGRLSLRWFRHNPMVLVQSLAESALSYLGVRWALQQLGTDEAVASALALVAMAASPAVLARVVADTRAAGPVTDRALVLATLGTLYALTLGSSSAVLNQPDSVAWHEALYPVLVVLGLSLAVGALLALVLRSALRFMSPTSENTSMLLLAVIAAAAAISAHLGGSAPLAALLGGLILKQLHPRPWSWPRQLGSAASLLTMTMFVLVSVVAAQAPWGLEVALLVGALIVARLLGKGLGVALGHAGSGVRWRQAAWVAAAMSPMSSVALLIASQFMWASPPLGQAVAEVALPAILLMEVLGAVVAAVALGRAGECSRPLLGPTSELPAAAEGAPHAS